MDVATFRQWFPEFSGSNDAAVQFWLDKAAPHFDVDRWGDLLEEGQANWVAHALTMRKRQADQAAAGGEDDFGVVKRRAGDTEVQWSEAMLLGQQATGGGTYSRTTYGQRYAELAGMVGRGAVAL